MAMGNFPFASSYLTGDPNVLLPAYPVKKMCELITNSTNYLEGINSAMTLYKNASGTEACLDVDGFHIHGNADNAYHYAACTEMSADEAMYATTGTTDMFYNNTFEEKYVDMMENC